MDRSIYAVLLGTAVMIAAVVFWNQSVAPRPVAPAPVKQAPRADPAPCNALLRDGEKVGLVRDRPAANRVDVDELVWASLPAKAKEGIVGAVWCSSLGGLPAPDNSFGVVYGYHTGKELAVMSEGGVSLGD
jgi:hypothetical protein